MSIASAGGPAFALAIFTLAACGPAAVAQNAIAQGEPYPGTAPLTMQGDLASAMVDGIDKFLLAQLQQAKTARATHWQQNATSIAAHRQRLAHILGVRDDRVPFDAPELLATTARPALVATTDTYQVHAVRWPALAGMHGEGLLLTPRKTPALAYVVAVPDADLTPEQIAGLVDGVPPASQYARRLAELGCQVLVPTLVSRERARRSPPGRSGGANLTHREFIYRSAFELGRHLIGYEVQKILAGVDWFARQAGENQPRIGVLGWGEGGMLALYAAALDERIAVCGVSGYFGTAEDRWRQPLDRNVFGLLERFGDAEVARLISPRTLIVDDGAYPELELAGEGGAPAVLARPPRQALADEVARARDGVAPGGELHLSPSNADQASPYWADGSLGLFYGHLASKPGKDATAALAATVQAAKHAISLLPDTPSRQQRQIQEMDRYNQQLLADSADVRKQFMSKLDTSSLENYAKTVEDYRRIFREDVIGAFDLPLAKLNPRTRKTYETERWTGYEVMLDVFPNVFAYGVLLVPRGMAAGERRPVVVCQHGLEGRPTDTFLNDHRAYHDYAAKLCERGFITFAPQNPYIFEDRFRTLQRKANPLGKTLFSIIVPQHQQLLNWLKTLPNVDPERIAFYGLSYGGKSAMRIPPLVTDYCLSICSADFNEWVAKNASTRLPFSYVWTKEYEIFEFDLGSTFNYAEMAALIAPRPFMVERGHTDGVSTDEWVAFEFAKVRNLYAHRLKLPDRCEIEFFDGPHTINGQGTFDFLHRHLHWPRPRDAR